MTDAPFREPSESTPERPKSALESDRYAHLPLGDGTVVIYDRTDPDTWLQSDVAVDVGT